MLQCAEMLIRSGNVTDERRVQPPLRSGGHNERIIDVQPLRREDMQVHNSLFLCRPTH
jgi:hypothetical protein